MEWKDITPGKQYMFKSRVKNFEHADGEVQYVAHDPDDGATAIVRRWDADGNDQVYFQVERHELYPMPAEPKRTLFEQATYYLAYDQRTHDLHPDHVKREINKLTNYELLEKISEALEDMKGK